MCQRREQNEIKVQPFGLIFSIATCCAHKYVLHDTNFEILAIQKGTLFQLDKGNGEAENG